ncbi:MAG: hypothetical protein ABIO72_00825 [Patescibacteria group bacterium]
MKCMQIKGGTMFGDIKDSKEERKLLDDRKLLVEIRERITQHKADLAIECERKKTLDSFCAVLDGEFERLSTDRPQHVRLSSLLPLRLRFVPVIGRLAEKIRINVTLAAFMAIAVLRDKRLEADATCKHLEFAIKDQTLREAYHARLVGEKPPASPTP